MTLDVVVDSPHPRMAFKLQVVLTEIPINRGRGVFVDVTEADLTLPLPEFINRLVMPAVAQVIQEFRPVDVQP